MRHPLTDWYTEGPLRFGLGIENTFVPQGVMMAGSLIAVLPLVIMFLLVQRRFIESVASTGLK